MTGHKHHPGVITVWIGILLHCRRRPSSSFCPPGGSCHRWPSEGSSYSSSPRGTVSPWGTSSSVEMFTQQLNFYESPLRNVRVQQFTDIDSPSSRTHPVPSHLCVLLILLWSARLPRTGNKRSMANSQRAMRNEKLPEIQWRHIATSKRKRDP